MNEFYQSPPSLPPNLFASDALLQSYLKSRFPLTAQSEIFNDLNSFGSRVAGEVLALGRAAESSTPQHISHGPWGERIDEIKVSEAWLKLHSVAAEEGLIELAYSRRHGEFSRLHQFAKLYLYHPSSAFYSCPLAMTDGAARALELYGDDHLKSEALVHLTSRDPKKFWTSGQWMTERSGGSDVGGTATLATAQDDGKWSLTGDKWFTSATTSEITLTLARPEGEPAGTRGLAMFYIRVQDEQGRLNKIEINRLKDKLGTDALPTAELRLRGTPAVMIGEKGEGVRKIATLLNITRLHNSVCATAQIRRALDLALDYSHKREAFGKKLIDHPLHVETLADITADQAACLHLVMHLAWLLGREECGVGSANESAILRLLTPVAKLWTAKRSLACVSECIEAFGGAGYIEDTGLPRLLRDAQVFSIWEGTTNVLALDMLRAAGKGDGALAAFADVERRLDLALGAGAGVAVAGPGHGSGLGHGRLRESVEVAVSGLRARVADLRAAFAAVGSADGADAQAVARKLAFELAEIFACTLMIEFACAGAGARDLEIALRFASRGKRRLSSSAEMRAASRLIVGV